MTALDKDVCDVINILLRKLDLEVDTLLHEDKSKFMLESSLKYGYIFDNTSNNLDEVFGVLLSSNDDDALKLSILNRIYELMQMNSFNVYVLRTLSKSYPVLFQLLSICKDDISDVVAKILKVMVCDSIDTCEIKQILQFFSQNNKRLNLHLMSILGNLPYNILPERYFMFLGGPNSGMIIPPLNDIYKQDNLSIVFWIYIDPKNGKLFDNELPFVYSFRTQDGLGYFCRIVGNCLCLTFQRKPNVAVNICIQRELVVKEWTFVCITRKRNAWGIDNITCYINGVEEKSLDTKINILKGVDNLERCSIGCSRVDGERGSFLGQISTFSMFSITLNAEQVKALYKLGVHYQGSYKFLNEAYHLLSLAEQRIIYDGSLLSSLVLSYNAYYTDQNLVLHAALQSSKALFVGYKHAQLMESTIVASHNSIYKSLHSIGGIKPVLNLFQFLPEHHLSLTISIIRFVCDLLINSFALLNQMLLLRGFKFINQGLRQLVNKEHDSEPFLPFITLCRHVQTSVFSHSPALAEQALKHIIIDIFFDYDTVSNISTPARDFIFAFIANEMAVAFSIFDRRFILHMIEQIFFILRGLDKDLSITTKLLLLLITRHLFLLNSSGDKEMLLLLSNIRFAKCYNEDNLGIYLDVVCEILSQNPRKLIPAFDVSEGCRCIVSLFDSYDHDVLIRLIRILSTFLRYSTMSRKRGTIRSQGIFDLIANKLTKSKLDINPKLIRHLIHLVFDIVYSDEVKEKNTKINSNLIIENPEMIITICSILSYPTFYKSSLILIFLTHLAEIIRNNNDNKRRILRLSLWQVYIGGFLNTRDNLQSDEVVINDSVYKIITELIYFAIHYEHDGWRVLIDTLAILYRHTSIQMSTKYDIRECQRSINDSVKISNFSLNQSHFRIINDLLDRIENDLLETINKSDCAILTKRTEQTYVINLAHTLCLLSDEICIMCGGLLHLISSISTNQDSWQFQSSLTYTEDPRRILFRLANIADILVIFNGQAFDKVEENLSQESGICLRQCFRLYLMCASISVMNHRHICATGSFNPVKRIAFLKDLKSPDLYLIDHLVYHIRNAQKRVNFDEIILDFINDPHSLLQEHDIYRLKLITTKDLIENMDNTKCVPLSLTYFLSILICTEYQRMLSSCDEDNTSKDRTSTFKESLNISSLNGNECHNDVTEKIDVQSIQSNTIRKIATNKFEAEIDRSLCITVPFLKMILNEFSHIIEKSIRGSDDQNIIGGGLHLLQSSEHIVPFAMLICSHEWQVALQLHAGYSFFELINESRIISADNSQHLMKVASEADYMIVKSIAKQNNNEHIFDQFIDNWDNEMLEHVDALKAKFKLQVYMNKTYTESLSREVKELIHGEQSVTDESNTSQLLWRLSMIEDRYRCRKSIVSYFSPNTIRQIPFINSYDVVTKPDGNDLINNKMINSLLKSNLKSSLSLIRNSSKDQLIDNDSGQVLEQLQNLSTFNCSFLSPIFFVAGTLCIEQSRFYFDSDSKILLDKLSFLDTKQNELTWEFTDISMILSRSYIAKSDSLEIFIINGTTIFFVFDNVNDVQKVVELLPPVGLGKSLGISSSRAVSLASPQFIFENSNVTERWQRRELTNFDYLMYLNILSGRSYQDLNQYPIFPWIISDYSSSVLDLNSPNTYRDLTKPIGALNSERLEKYKDRFKKWHDDSIPSFYYGSHYSTIASVLNWLIRVEPFTSGFIEMQGGMFDSNDRIFNSISQSWQSCLNDFNNVKEIIPEFFYLPEIFVNLNKLSFGEACDGSVLGDVHLPPWCASPEDFVRKNRMALESELVSCQLHCWIDLIFGYKQRGPPSVQADNVFYYLTYLDDIPPIDSFDDQVLAKSIITQIRSFGRVPAQLLIDPHPPRISTIKANPSIYESVEENVCIVLNLQSQSSIVFLSTYNTASSSYNTNQLSRMLPTSNSCIITISKNFEFACNPYDHSDQVRLSSNVNTLPVQPDRIISRVRPQRKYLGYSFDPAVDVTSDRFAVSPNNKVIIATGYWDKTFRLIHSETSDLRQVIFGHFEIVTCVTIGLTHSSLMIVTGSKDRTLLTWIFDRNKCLIVDRNNSSQDVNPSPFSILYGHEDAVMSVKLSESANGLVFSLSMPKSKPIVLQHDIYGNYLRRMFTSHLTPLLQTVYMDVAAGGTDDLILNYNNCLYLISLNGKLLNTLEIPDRQITALKFDQSGEFVILGSKSGHVLVYSKNSLNFLRQYPRCDAAISALAITENKRHIVAGLSNGRLVLLNINFNTLLV